MDAELLDILGKRYSHLPTDLIKLTPGELSINLKIAIIGIQAEKTAQDQAIDDAESESQRQQR